MSYNFVHLSIQEMLAAFCISKMKDVEQVLSYIKCFFVAQVTDQLLYQQIVPRLNGELNLSHVIRSPLDAKHLFSGTLSSWCTFLAFVLTHLPTFYMQGIS